MCACAHLRSVSPVHPIFMAIDWIAVCVRSNEADQQHARVVGKQAIVTIFSEAVLCCEFGPAMALADAYGSQPIGMDDGHYEGTPKVWRTRQSILFTLCAVSGPDAIWDGQGRKRIRQHLFGTRRDDHIRRIAVKACLSGNRLPQFRYSLRRRIGCPSLQSSPMRGFNDMGR